MVQVMVPVAVANLPAMQAEHEAKLKLFANVPTAHEVHLDNPLDEA
jgi:hypothetical protein